MVSQHPKAPDGTRWPHVVHRCVREALLLLSVL
jgi:hypothetical protein